MDPNGNLSPMKAPTAFGATKRAPKRVSRPAAAALASPPPPPPPGPALVRRNPSAFGYLSNNLNDGVHRARQALIAALAEHAATHPAATARAPRAPRAPRTVRASKRGRHRSTRRRR